MVLPKPIRMAYYWLLKQGKIGYALFNVVNFFFYLYVKICRIKPKRDMSCLAIISHKHKFIYIGVPKTATRSFLNLFVFENPQNSYDVEWHEYDNAHIDAVEKYPDYFKFSFVRNPWSRALSCYQSKVNDKVFGKIARILVYYKGLKQCMPFKDYAAWLNTPEGGDEIADRHWMSMHQFLLDADGVLIPDYVGQYEELEQGVAEICDKLGIEPFQLPHKGFISGSKKYHEHYDDDARDLIAKRYEKDIALFGYEF